MVASRVGFRTTVLDGLYKHSEAFDNHRCIMAYDEDREHDKLCKIKHSTRRSKLSVSGDSQMLQRDGSNNHALFDCLIQSDVDYEQNAIWSLRNNIVHKLSGHFA